MNIEEYAKEHKITVVIIFLAVLIAVYYVFKSYEENDTAQPASTDNSTLLQAQVAQQTVAAQYASNLLKYNQAQANTQAQLANNAMNIQAQIANNALQYKAMTDVANIQAQQNVITNSLQAQTEQQANYMAAENTYNTDVAQMVVNQQNAQAATNQAAIAAQAGVYNAALNNQAQVYMANAAAQANIAQSQAQVNIANQAAQANIAQSQAQVNIANQQAQSKVGTAYNQAQANIATSAYNAAGKIGAAAQIDQYVPAAPPYMVNSGSGANDEGANLLQTIALQHAYNQALAAPI